MSINKKILVLNAGSSSIKYQLFGMPDQEVLCSGLIERIGLDKGEVHFKSTNHKINKTVAIPSHKEGLEFVVDLLLDKDTGVINATSDIEIVAHRVVHGGSAFSKTTVVTDEVKVKIKELFPLAPQHNPANLQGIEVCEVIFTKAQQVAVFDTAFHQTMPTRAYKYAIPNVFLDDHNIRVYGFHGTSHKYVSQQAIAYLNQPKSSKLVSIHLGNGCSITAIQNGKSIDQSLGFSTATGLIMGSRAGDLDHSVIFYLVNQLGYNLNDVEQMLHKESGMLGLTGFSDLRDIEAEAEKGNKACQLALHMNAYRIKKYLGAYIAAMNGIDAIIFTAGIGENSDVMRKLICEDLSYFGIDLDNEKNNTRAKVLTEVNTANSKVKILVIPTNEELEMANQAFQLLEA